MVFQQRDQGANGGGAQAVLPMRYQPLVRTIAVLPMRYQPLVRTIEGDMRQGTVIYRVVARSHLCIYYTVRFPSESNI